jgi:hypothetical protein
VTAGQRASVEMDFPGGSPETTKTSAAQEPSPQASPSPVGQPSPKGRGSKAPPMGRTRVVWEEPPPLIPAATEPASPGPSATPLPKGKPVPKISTRVALVSESGNTGKRKALPSPSPAITKDTAKALGQRKERWRAEEEALKLEKEQIENGIRNSTGSVREQWKYRLAVWQGKMNAAKKEEAAVQ